MSKSPSELGHRYVRYATSVKDVIIREAERCFDNQEFERAADYYNKANEAFMDAMKLTNDKVIQAQLKQLADLQLDAASRMLSLAMEASAITPSSGLTSPNSPDSHGFTSNHAALREAMQMEAAPSVLPTLAPVLSSGDASMRASRDTVTSGSGSAFKHSFNTDVWCCGSGYHDKQDEFRRAFREAMESTPEVDETINISPLHVTTTPKPPSHRRGVELVQTEGYDPVIGSVINIDKQAQELTRDQLVDIIRRQKAHIERLEREISVLTNRLDTIQPVNTARP